MKKTVFTFVVFIITIPLFSQTQKGWWLWGSYVGSGSYSKGSSDDGGSPPSNSKTNNFTIDISPNIGYFIEDNLAIGSFVGFNFSTGKTTYTYSSGDYSKYHSTTFTIGPYLRYYFSRTGKNLTPYAEVFTGLGTGPYISKTKFGIAASESKFTNNRWNAGFNVGLANFITTNIAMQFYAGFNHSHYASKSKSAYGTYKYDYNYFNFGVGFQMHKPGKSAKGK